MKPIFCKDCKWNKNGWCFKYECNGKKKLEVCDKYKDELDYYRDLVKALVNDEMDLETLKELEGDEE